LSEVLLESVKENNRKNVVIAELAHGHDAFTIRAKFGESLAERFVMTEINIKNFEKKVELSVSALLFVH
jgi:hypothetical protein